MYELIVYVQRANEYAGNPKSVVQFLARGELSGWLSIRMSGVNNGKFVIDFRSSQVRQALLCIHFKVVVKNALVKQKNV